MTLDQLETFIAIADEGGLRAASKVLHKTQPTLSTGIKNLELELGLQLLNRDSYRVQLTEHGKTLYTKAKEILAKAEEFKAIATEFEVGREAQLNLAVDYLCPTEFLLKVLNKFKKSCGETKIELDFEVLMGAQTKLAQKEVNLALTPFFHPSKKIEFKKVCDLKIIPVISKQLLNQFENTKSCLEEIPQIIVKTPGQENEKSPFQSLTDSPQWKVSDHLIKKELITNSFGWGHLEESSIQKELKAGKLVELKSKSLKSQKLPLYLLRTKSMPFGPAAKDLWNFLDQEFKNK